MVSVNKADVLAAWEQGFSMPGFQRLLNLLTSVHSDMSFEQLLKLPIGRRDSLALSLRESLFGPHLNSLAACPFCTQQLEFALDASDIRVEPHEPLQHSYELELEGFELCFRLPDSQDLMAIEGLESIDAARSVLLERCLLAVFFEGQAFALDHLPEEILNKLEDAMSSVDPQAEVKLDLSCPACYHSWLATFDIASFLWREISAWAERLLNEVHVLAKAYAWKEADILAMSSVRRQFYLERVMS